VPVRARTGSNDSRSGIEPVARNARHDIEDKTKA